MESLERVLRVHPFLQGLGDAHVKLLVGCAKNARFEPGARLLREGDDATTVFLVREGRVALEVNRPGSPSVRVETVGPGDVLGVSWVFPGEKVHLDGVALTPVLAFELDGACIRDKMEADHDLGYALLLRMLELAYLRLERVRLQKVDVYQ
jgi:CRP-like cAMP-binding protein